jgi:GTP cyclohydrolase II
MLYRGGRPLRTVHGQFIAHVFQNLVTGAYGFVLTRGDISSREPLLVRLHSSCMTSETYGGLDCDCVDQLDAALAQIARAGRGAVFYLMQEGRGAGFAAKARDRMIVQASEHRLTTFEAYERMGLGRDHRRYDEVAPMSRLLGISAAWTLLTNNPDKIAAVREADGVRITATLPLRHEPSPYNAHYLAAKSRSGHRLDDPGDSARGAELPERVRYFDPYPLRTAPRFVRLATYLLPVAVDGELTGVPCWFRVHAYFDLTGGHERAVLEHGPRRASAPLVRVQRERMLERFPLDGGGRDKPLWRETVRRIWRHGSGCAVFFHTAGFDRRLEEEAGERAPAVALLAHHLRGRTVYPLRASADDDSWSSTLAEHGIECRAAVALGGGSSERAEA